MRRNTCTTHSAVQIPESTSQILGADLIRLWLRGCLAPLKEPSTNADRPVGRLVVLSPGDLAAIGVVVRPLDRRYVRSA